jgi:hypothetical protein
MKRSYEGNQQLRDLAQSMDFKAFIFDDPTTFGPEILLREKSKDGEIDGVLLFENVICLVGINEGRGNHVERELTKFFEKLDKIKKVEDVGFDLRVTARKGKKIEEKKRKANEALGEVENCISDICKEYRPILRKIFFCPSMRIEEERMAKLETEGSFIVDRFHAFSQNTKNRFAEEIGSKDAKARKISSVSSQQTGTRKGQDYNVFSANCRRRYHELCYCSKGGTQV